MSLKPQHTPGKQDPDISPGGSPSVLELPICYRAPVLLSLVPLPNHTSLFPSPPTPFPVLIQHPFYFHLKIKRSLRRICGWELCPLLVSSFPVLELCPWVSYPFFELRDWERVGRGETWGWEMGEQSRGERGSNREKAVEMVRPRGRNGGRGRRQRGSQRSGGCRLRGYGGGKGRVGSGWSG